jgi:transposase
VCPNPTPADVEERTRLQQLAAFAALAGSAPLPASSSRHQRHRLNRGGDRTLNAALHTIVTTRRRMNRPATSAYIARRAAEGLSPKEALRCLKRYTARQLFRLMQATSPATTRQPVLTDLLSYLEPRPHRSPAPGHLH